MTEIKCSQRNEDGKSYCSYHTSTECSYTLKCVRGLREHCRKIHKIIITPTIWETVNCVKSADGTFICSEQSPSNCCSEVFKNLKLLKHMP